MKIHYTFILALALSIAGCGSAQQQPPVQVNSTQPSPTQAVALNPTDAFKIYNDAKRNKDAEGVKKVLSKSSLALTAKTAEQKDQPLETVLLSGQAFVELPPIRNEKITGDTASIEIQNPQSGGWEEWFLVKEDGVWKNDLNRLVENTMKRLADAMNQPPPTNSTPGKNVKK